MKFKLSICLCTVCNLILILDLIINLFVTFNSFCVCFMSYVDKHSCIHSFRSWDVAQWLERLLVVWWVVRSITPGEPVELCLVPTSAP